MSDIFREVDEEVRRERLKQLWERHSNLIVAVALLIVLGVAGWRGYDWWELRKAAESGTRFEAAVKLAEEGKQTEAQAAFSKIAQDGSSGYRILARFREGAELAKTDAAAAAKVYGSLAADFEPRPHAARSCGRPRGHDPGGHRAACGALRQA